MSNMQPNTTCKDIDFEEFTLFDDAEIDRELDNFLAPLTCTERAESWGRLFDKGGDFYASSYCFPGKYRHPCSPLTPPPMEAKDKDRDYPCSPPQSSPIEAKDPHLGRILIVQRECNSRVQDSVKINGAELQRQYIRTLKKLNKSMRRSNETRSIIKCQRGNDEKSFYTSRRWSELEQDRYKIFKSIQIQHEIVRPVFGA
jgi:hypothetical protein